MLTVEQWKDTGLNNMSDPMQQFRRKQASAKTSLQVNKRAEKKPYEAFDNMGNPYPYLEIRCLLQPSQAPQSCFLMSVVFSSDYDEAFTLVYSFMAVEIRGNNLKKVRQAIQNGCCEFIQEYHDNEFTAPDKNAPVIDSIKFIAGKKLDDILSSHRIGK